MDTSPVAKATACPVSKFIVDMSEVTKSFYYTRCFENSVKIYKLPFINSWIFDNIILDYQRKLKMHL
jgi:hypothetical protein